MKLQVSHTGEKELTHAPKHEVSSTPQGGATSIPQIVQAAVAGESQRNLDLAAGIREKMSRQFGLDFSSVRLVESDLPRILGADAVAQGDLVRFAPGAYHPETAQGERLLSHELSHVVQQSRGKGMGGVAGMPWVDTATENSADAMAAQAISGSLITGPTREFTPVPASEAPMLGGNIFSTASSPAQAPVQSTAANPNPISQPGQNTNTPTRPAWWNTPQESGPQLPPWWYQFDPEGPEKPQLPDWWSQAKQYLPTVDMRLAFYNRYVDAKNKWYEAHEFNTNMDPNIENHLRALDDAQSLEDLKTVYQEIVGRDIAGSIGGDNSNINPNGVRIIMKSMVQMLMDFPELKNAITRFGNTNDPDAFMSFANGEYLLWNGRENAADTFNDIANGGPKYRYDGTHELGHALNRILDQKILKGGTELDQTGLQNGGITANFILVEALLELIRDPLFEKTQKTELINFFLDKKNSPDKDDTVDFINYAYLFDLNDAKIKQYNDWSTANLQTLYKIGLISQDSTKNVSELFAESVKDVYQNKEDAGDLSKKIMEIVKRLTSPQDQDWAKQWGANKVKAVKTMFPKMVIPPNSVPKPPHS